MLRVATKHCVRIHTVTCSKPLNCWTATPPSTQSLPTTPTPSHTRPTTPRASTETTHSHQLAGWFHDVL